MKEFQNTGTIEFEDVLYLEDFDKEVPIEVLADYTASCYEYGADADGNRGDIREEYEITNFQVYLEGQNITDLVNKSHPDAASDLLYKVSCKIEEHGFNQPEIEYEADYE